MFEVEFHGSGFLPSLRITSGWISEVDIRGLHYREMVTYLQSHLPIITQQKNQAAPKGRETKPSDWPYFSDE